MWETSKKVTQIFSPTSIGSVSNEIAFQLDQAILSNSWNVFSSICRYVNQSSSDWDFFNKPSESKYNNRDMSLCQGPSMMGFGNKGENLEFLINLGICL